MKILVLPGDGIGPEIVASPTSRASSPAASASRARSWRATSSAARRRSTAPALAGKDVADPVSMILSVAMLMAWLGKRHGRDDLAQAAVGIDRSVDAILEDPATRTADLGGTLGCRAFARRVAAHVGA